MKPIVNIEGLTKTYGKRRGISGITFAIEEGEVFGFIGPNGAGKSTTIRTLLNIIFPTSGSASIFGKDVVTQSLDIRRQIGYLPSEVFYYDDMKVVDLLRFAAAFHRCRNEKRIADLAGRLDLDLNRKIEDLSFGNRKKVGIAQALLHEPKLLILDEPTGGLDPLMQNTFFELLKEERAKGTTIFFSSHILSEVQRMCDRVAIIKDGSLIKVESVENLMRNNLRHITLTARQPDEIDLSAIAGIVRRERIGTTHLKLLYDGDMKAFVQGIAGCPFTDILIEEPSLDEIFLHYYTN
ncbi:ABC transporter ATP-binding protein [Paenibacillus glycinis]|uniref:ATP-binding cassette domain-containing protein n=1 Tax=Paenibacillus glycinis TaxID=2697035 RepID=A0ABW9XSG9_9BACL|nr:ABC transporter ATP-binding protein [Paenibacillus glycinis]NBD25570.1 ATP-binding cassette domain-containing protein [Paenibacillus glycinis]